MTTLMIPMAATLLGLALLATPADAGAPLALTAPLLLADDDDDDDGGRRWVRPRHVERHYYQGIPRHYHGDDEDDEDRRYRSWRFRRRGDDDDDDDGDD